LPFAELLTLTLINRLARGEARPTKRDTSQRDLSGPASALICARYQIFAFRLFPYPAVHLSSSVSEYFAVVFAVRLHLCPGRI
jgi:hypothetical protein